MRGRAITYSEAELAWIKGHRDLPRRQTHAAFVERFGRRDVSLTNYNALCKRNGWMTGRTGRYEPGRTPENKGKPMSTATRAKVSGTWFKKGERRGVATNLYKPIGTERTSKDGYLERKINDDLPLQARWRAVHLINWEALHGPLPEGYALKCLSDDRGNPEPSNWEAIPRALLPRLNGRFGRGYDAAPAEVKPTILAITKLEHAAREAKAAHPAQQEATHG